MRRRLHWTPQNTVQHAVEVTKDKVVEHFRGPYSPLEKDGVKWAWGYAAATVEMARVYVEMFAEMLGTANALLTVANWLRGEAAVITKWRAPCTCVREETG